MIARRLFFALWPDDSVRHALLHWQTQNLPGDVRWQHRADLHLTLSFLGQVEEQRIAGLRDVGAAQCSAAFTLQIDEIGYWPRPQVLWAGPRVPGEQLVELHARLVSDLEALGFAREERPFRPHITLARKVRERPISAVLAPLQWEVRELALVESRAGAAPHYRLLARWPLS